MLERGGGGTRMLGASTVVGDWVFCFGGEEEGKSGVWPLDLLTL